jgi:hypothetical protein
VSNREHVAGVTAPDSRPINRDDDVSAAPSASRIEKLGVEGRTQSTVAPDERPANLPTRTAAHPHGAHQAAPGIPWRHLLRSRLRAVERVEELVETARANAAATNVSDSIPSAAITLS